MAAVLVHIDLDGERPHPSSLVALAAGRAVASSWGGTLNAALVVHDPPVVASPSVSGQISIAQMSRVEEVRAALARGGADKVVVALADSPTAPLWAAVGSAWQAVLDHLQPRLVLFGADAPSTAELGPRTGARIGARMLSRARAVGADPIELQDRDGGFVRASDGGAAVAIIGAARATTAGDDDVDVVVLAIPNAADPRIEFAGSAPCEPDLAIGAIVALDEVTAGDAQVFALASQLATLLKARLRIARSTADGATALAPELCIAIGEPAIDLAGATTLIRIAALPGPVAGVLTDLVHALERA